MRSGAISLDSRPAHPAHAIAATRLLATLRVVDASSRETMAVPRTRATSDAVVSEAETKPSIRSRSPRHHHRCRDLARGDNQCPSGCHSAASLRSHRPSAVTHPGRPSLSQQASPGRTQPPPRCTHPSMPSRRHLASVTMRQTPTTRAAAPACALLPLPGPQWLPPRSPRSPRPLPPRFHLAPRYRSPVLRGC